MSDARADGSPLADRFSKRTGITVAVAVLFVLLAGVRLAFPDTIAGDLFAIVTDRTTLGAALRLAVPITLAALGGIFAEKSGVINIGLEGLLIISAFTSIAVAGVISGGSPTQLQLWIGFVVGIRPGGFGSVGVGYVLVKSPGSSFVALPTWVAVLLENASDYLRGRPTDHRREVLNRRVGIVPGDVQDPPVDHRPRPSP